MPNGYLVQGGLVSFVVYGHTGVPAEGYTFVADENPTSAVVGQPPPVKYVPVHVVRERLEAAGKWDDVVTILLAPANQTLFVKLVTLESGIDPADPVAISMIQAVGEDPSVILATP